MEGHLTGWKGARVSAGGRKVPVRDSWAWDLETIWILPQRETVACGGRAYGSPAPVNDWVASTSRVKYGSNLFNGSTLILQYSLTCSCRGIWS